jgi:hypothetical protein
MQLLPDRKGYHILNARFDAGAAAGHKRQMLSRCFRRRRRPPPAARLLLLLLLMITYTHT